MPDPFMISDSLPCFDFIWIESAHSGEFNMLALRIFWISSMQLAQKHRWFVDFVDT
jgi:hypothetical protein